MIKDHLSLDGNPVLNLASYVLSSADSRGISLLTTAQIRDDLVRGWPLLLCVDRPTNVSSMEDEAEKLMQEALVCPA